MDCPSMKMSRVYAWARVFNNTLSSQIFRLSQQQTSTSYAQGADSQNSSRVPVANEKRYRYATIYSIVSKSSDYKRKLNSLRRLSCRSNNVSWIWYSYCALCAVTHTDKRTKQTCCILCLLFCTFYDLYTLILCTTDQCIVGMYSFVRNSLTMATYHLNM